MARVLLIDDRDATPTLDLLQVAGHAVTHATSAGEGLAHANGAARFDLVITESTIGEYPTICRSVVERRPNVPVIVITDQSTMGSAIRALRAGAYDFLAKPFEEEALRAALRRALRHRTLSEEVTRLRRRAAEREASPIVGESEAIERVLRMIERVCESDTSVLITGESGTGKELAARELHARSRIEGPFVAVNCAAMPANLLESELFGHVQGAFTGARRARTGLFVEADGGTLFLDEIGELPVEMQPKLLRALQERVARPVGGSNIQPFEVRLVTATNRDLEAEVASGRFREDLFYRVNVVKLEIPPLRDRGHDILLLAQVFIERFAERLGRRVRGLSKEAAARLLAHDWPGNVRELRNCIERAVTLTRSKHLSVRDLPKKLRGSGEDATWLERSDAKTLPTLAVVEQRYVRQVIEAVGGNKTRAAKILGVDRRTLYRKMARWNAP